MVVHDVVLELRGHLRVRLVLLHVNRGQGFSPAEDAVIEAAEYVALEEEKKEKRNLDRCR